jgi:hypothetical protein
MKDE